MNHSVRWCIPCHNHDFDHGDEWCDMMAMAHPQKTVSSFFENSSRNPCAPCMTARISEIFLHMLTALQQSSHVGVLPDKFIRVRINTTQEPRIVRGNISFCQPSTGFSHHKRCSLQRFTRHYLHCTWCHQVLPDLGFGWTRRLARDTN